MYGVGASSPSSVFHCLAHSGFVQNHGESTEPYCAESRQKLCMMCPRVQPALPISMVALHRTEACYVGIGCNYQDIVNHSKLSRDYNFQKALICWQGAGGEFDVGKMHPRVLRLSVAKTKDSWTHGLRKTEPRKPSRQHKPPTSALQRGPKTRPQDVLAWPLYHRLSSSCCPSELYAALAALCRSVAATGVACNCGWPHRW